MGGGASKSKYKEKKAKDAGAGEPDPRGGSKERRTSQNQSQVVEVQPARRPSKVNSEGSSSGRRPSKIDGGEVTRSMSKQSGRRASSKDVKAELLRQNSKGANDKKDDDFDPRASRSRPSIKDAIQQSNDPSVHRFKVGDRVLGMGKIGREYGLGTVKGLWENKSGTLRVAFDSGKEMPVKGDNLNIITEKQEEAMKKMSPAALDRLLGEGIIKDGKK